jgi:hypothetical protein
MFISFDVAASDMDTWICVDNLMCSVVDESTFLTFVERAGSKYWQSRPDTYGYEIFFERNVSIVRASYDILTYVKSRPDDYDLFYGNETWRVSARRGIVEWRLRDFSFTMSEVDQSSILVLSLGASGENPALALVSGLAGDKELIKMCTLQHILKLKSRAAQELPPARVLTGLIYKDILWITPESVLDIWDRWIRYHLSDDN